MTVDLTSNLEEAMPAEVYLVRSQGVKIRDKEASSILPIVGDLALGARWISETRTKPALELRRPSDCSGTDVFAVLFDPKLVSMHANVMYFTRFEVLTMESGLRALVIQEWRCLTS